MAGDKEFEAVVDNYAEQYPVRDPGKKLEYACLHIFAQDSRVEPSVLRGRQTTDVDLSEFNPGASGDKEVDGILYDDDGLHVIILQCKYQSKKDAAGLTKSAKSFFAGVPTWESDLSGSANKRLVELLRECDFKPKQQSVELFFCTNQNIGGPEFNQARDEAARFERDYVSKGYRVSCRIVGASELLDLNRNFGRERDGSGLNDEVLDLKKGLYFEFAEGAQQVVVAAVKVGAIAQLYNKKNVGVSLFSSNIRVGLSSTNINRQIEESVKSSPERFFVLNNGLTVTCKSFEILDEPPHIRLRLTKPQVVNGAQTVTSIVNALKNDSQTGLEAWVLVRVIDTQEKYGSSEVLEITRAQNRQNAVKDWDFRSNDAIHQWLYESGFDRINSLPAMKAQSMKFVYEYKRGAVKKVGAGQVKISLDKLGLLRFASLYGPTEVFTKPRAFWSFDTDAEDDASLYWKAFGRDGAEISSYNSAEIAHLAWSLAVNERIIQTAVESRKRASSGPGNLKAYQDLVGGNLKALSRWVLALASYSIRLATNDDLSYFERTMSSKTEFDSCYGIYVAEAIQITMDLLAERTERKEARPGVNLSKSDGDWRKATEKVAFRVATRNV